MILMRCPCFTDTGDSYHRSSTPAEEAETHVRLVEKTVERVARMDKWLNGDSGEGTDGAAAPAVASAPTEDVVMG